MYKRITINDNGHIICKRSILGVWRSCLVTYSPTTISLVEKTARISALSGEWEKLGDSDILLKRNTSPLNGSHKTLRNKGTVYPL